MFLSRMRLFSLSCLALALVGCAQVGRDYSPPEVPVPANYKEQTNRSQGFSSQWWRRFDDAKLNALQADLVTNSRDLAAAVARYDQALARLGVARAETFPQVTASGGVSRLKQSTNNQFGGGGGQYFTLYSVAANLGYELDVWGRVRRVVEAGAADLGAAEADLADVRVMLQTQLARQYFALRFIDAEKAVLRDAVTTREETLRLAQDRLAAGTTSELDTSRAEAELATAQADLLALDAPRAELENSIAVLIGKNASTFRITPRAYRGTIPSIPTGLPGALLSRRPDVARAERSLAAASARIGVAEGDFFPKIRLTASAGQASIDPDNFLEESSRTFGIGPAVEVPIFTGGLLKGRLKAAQAEQQEALATFQQTALVAFADVENALAAVSAARREEAARQRTVDASRKAYDLANLRYDEGADSYLTVIDSQRVVLQAERALVQTRGKRFAAAVQLVQALGGGYSRGAK